MKTIAACFLSAVAASALTAWMSDVTPRGQLAAQNRDGVRGPSFVPEPPVPSASAARPLPARAFDGEGLTVEESVAVAVYENVNRSVVNITTRSTRVDRLFLTEMTSEGSGSGSVLDKSGHILTNNHVIGDAVQVSVTLYNGESYEAAFVGADPINDIAVMKIDAPPDVLFPVTLGDSRRLKVGMRVFALGNPFGLERTLTSGIIASLNRSLQLHADRTIRAIIQIDASINPGSSGGPLLDAHGRLIGINTAIATSTGQSAGVGFAIPVNLVSRVVPQLLEFGHVIRTEIGITRALATDQGLLIAQLKPGGPAEAAGLRGPRTVRSRRGPFIVERLDRTAADVIVAIDDQKMESWDDFLSYIEGKDPGDQVVLTLLRDGRRIQVPITLGSDTSSGPSRAAPPRRP